MNKEIAGACRLLAAALAICFVLGGARAEPAPALSVQAENPFMQAALEEALAGISGQHGGPFGSVIVRDGVIVGRGHNRVLTDRDPTCHREIAAIRDACARLDTHDLSGCVLYTTAEPCPMCLFACLWARIDRVYYGCTILDTERIGFRDADLDSAMGGREQLSDYLVCLDREACLALFDIYLETEHTVY